MAGNVATFMEDVKRGRISTSNFLEGISNFAQELDLFLGASRERTPGNQPPNHGGRDGLQPAVNSFVALTVMTCAKQLPPHIFLNTPFSYEKTQAECEPIPQLALVNGLESLLQIYLRLPTSKPLQRWANIAAAANFSVGDQQVTGGLTVIREHVGQPGDLTTADPILQATTSGEAILEASQRVDLADFENIEGHEDSDSYSLGLMVEQFHGVRRDCVEDDSLPGYRRAFENWNTLLRSFVSDSINHQKFRSTLSTPQLNSARLLIEWWNGEIDDQSTSEKAFQAFERAAGAGILDDDTFQILKISESAIADEERRYYQQRFISGALGTPYCTFMFLLYQVEFLPYHYSGQLSRKVLSGQRMRAAKIAACQRIATTCYKSLLKECGLEPRPGDANPRPSNPKVYRVNGNGATVAGSGQVTAPLIRGVMVKEDSQCVGSTATTAQNITLGAENINLSADERERLAIAIHGDPGSKIGAAISSCHWLEDTGAQDDLPYYLWDVKQRRTVVARKITGEVQYTAISHTWGRWRIPNSPPVRVDGVNRWMIPENSKFRVKELPEILASVPFALPYVWFDLLCIPQKPTDQDLIKIAKREIGRQARIFRRAKFALAWLNDIDSWEGLQAAIRRLSIRYLQEGNGSEVPKPVLDLAMQNADLPLEIFDSTSVQTANPEKLMNGWFSSLWTFQELCLRPDMRLCTKDWNILAVGENGKTIVGMDDLIALAEGGNFTQVSQSRAEESPELGASGKLQSTHTPMRIEVRSKATEQLWELLDLSGLEFLLNASRATILTLGNQRYCEEDRAKAIMSAIDVVDWYNNPKGPDIEEIPPESPDQYPLAFLREAAKKIGADFYASSLAEGELLEMLVLSLNSGEVQRGGVGSMAPFTSSLLSRAPSFSEGYTGTDHPAVSTWEMLPDKSVEIREAGILSYSGQNHPENRNLTCDIVAPDLSEPASLLVQVHKNVDLDTWVDSFIPTTKNFAVCLHHNLGFLDGILLKELSSGELIKVGTYMITKRNAYKDVIAKTYKVRWRVL
ncbi:hypothetical protein FGG08_006740 [Glutinoglossum americanum]|uniref:Heterokaryon incompatibility domain-containing protein n=1 Tax=Glutinoglossum americanum TaxID=1670608 RepID=A0A9P8I4P6_9PEZI|nr:hypothetical protein FGG08_006740 [Glutinoglossum americanum]